MRLGFTPAALIPILLTACASTGDGGEVRTGWARYAEEAPPPPGPLQGALSVPTPSVRPYPEREFTAEEKAFFDSAWSAFKVDAPEWPDLKERWRAVGPEAEGLLAWNLYRGMVAARAGGALRLSERARKELVLMGEAAVPALVAGLSVRAVRREDGEEIRVGQEVLHEAAGALSVIGAASVPGLMDIAGSGEKVVAREAVGALGNIGDPRSEALLLRLADDPDAETRAAAVLALRRFGDGAARGRLVAALEDPDSFVAQRAAQALVTEKRTDAVPDLVVVLERGVREGRIFSVRASSWALQRLTGQNLGSDAAAWRRWAEKNP